MQANPRKYQNLGQVVRLPDIATPTRSEITGLPVHSAHAVCDLNVIARVHREGLCVPIFWERRQGRLCGTAQDSATEVSLQSVRKGKERTSVAEGSLSANGERENDLCAFGLPMQPWLNLQFFAPFAPIFFMGRFLLRGWRRPVYE